MPSGSSFVSRQIGFTDGARVVALDAVQLR
jgi:hypothetical protein